MPKPILQEFIDNNDLVSKIAALEAKVNSIPDQAALIHMKELYDQIKGEAEHYLRIDIDNRQVVQGPLHFNNRIQFGNNVGIDGEIRRKRGDDYVRLVDEDEHYKFNYKYPKYVGNDLYQKHPADDEFTPWAWAKRGHEFVALVNAENRFTESQTITRGNEIAKEGTYDEQSEQYHFTPPETYKDSEDPSIAYSDYVTEYDLRNISAADLQQSLKVIKNLDQDQFFNPTPDCMLVADNSISGIVEQIDDDFNTPIPYLLTTTADKSPGGDISFRIGTEKVEVSGEGYIYRHGFSNQLSYIGNEIWTKGIHITPSFTKPIFETIGLTTTYTPELKPVYPTLDLRANFAMYPTGKALNTSTKELDEFDTSFLVATDSMFWITPSKSFQIRGGNESQVGIIKVSATNNVYSVDHYATERFYEPVRISPPPPISGIRAFLDVGEATTQAYTSYFQVTSDAIVTRNKILGYLSGDPVFSLTSETTGAVFNLNGAIAVNRQTEEGSLFSVSYTLGNTNTPVVHNLMDVDSNGTVIYKSLAVSSEAGTALAAISSDWTYSRVPIVASAGATIMAREVADTSYHPILQVASESTSGDANLLLAVTHNKGLNRSKLITIGEVELQDYQGHPMLTTQLVDANWEFWVYNKIVYPYDCPDDTPPADREIAPRWYVKQTVEEAIPTTGVWELQALLYLMHTEQDSDPVTDVNAPKKAATHGYVHGYVDDYVDDALTPYSKTSDMHGYVAGALAPYAQTSWVLNELQDYPNFDELDSRLMSYPTFAQLQSYLASYAQITYVDNRLALYVLKTELTSTLGGYATIGYVNSQLGGYSTKNYVDQSSQQAVTESKSYTNQSSQTTLQESKSYSDQGFLGAVRDAVIEGIEYFNGNVGKSTVETTQGEEDSWIGDVIKFVGEGIKAVQNFFPLLFWDSNEEPPLPIELEPDLYATHSYTRAQVEDYLQYYTPTQDGDDRWALKEEIPSLEGYATEDYVTTVRDEIEAWASEYSETYTDWSVDDAKEEMKDYTDETVRTSRTEIEDWTLTVVSERQLLAEEYTQWYVDGRIPSNGKMSFSAIYGTNANQDTDPSTDTQAGKKFATHAYVQAQMNNLKEQITNEIKKWIIQQIIEGE